ncbi:MAG: hypothetical protein QOI20_2208 [Acidimicrobiaceae bacterium]|jgi:galactose mutarotase-like enzyme|nr:hypothetical protein [Acidimicrobiaceae bacterium]
MERGRLTETTVRWDEVRGWDVLTLHSEELSVSVVPGKGGDITSIRWRPLDMELLWQSPWGLRRRGSVAVPGESHVRFLEEWSGGWQTIFPNAGAGGVRYGVEQPFHGEAALAPWEVVAIHDAGDGPEVVLETRLTRSPFRMRRHLHLVGGALEVEETACNEGHTRYDAMWLHHPSFGPPLLGPDCRIRTTAGTVRVDPHVLPQTTDVLPGAVGQWPEVAAAERDSEVSADLSRLPGPGAGLVRMAYLHDFPGPARVALENHAAGVSVAMTWDTESHPCAWLWLEAGATVDFPFWGTGYVLAVEPAWAGAPDAQTGVRPLLAFEPGHARTAHTRLEVTAL